VLEGDVDQIHSIKWILNETLVDSLSAISDEQMNTGKNILKAEIWLKSGINLCSEKVITLLPHSGISYETRYLEDKVHYENDSMIWSGNTVFINEKMYKFNSCFFELDRLELSNRAKSILDNNIRTIKNFDNILIRIGTFTHSGGDFDLNRSWSLKRSNLVREYMISTGLSASQLSVADPGKDYMLKNTCAGFPDCSYVDTSLDLRTDFKIIKF